jgi:hypothetical protein
MVRAVRKGQAMRQVAREFRVSLATVQKWVRHAGHGRLDRVDFADRRPGPATASNKTPLEIERLVLDVRCELKENSALGEYGARAIHRELQRRRIPHPPCERTIGRILARQGATDAHPRVRRRPPPPGWYLPSVAADQAELDSFDIVEGLVLQGGHRVEVLNAVSLHGGLVASWPRASITAKTVFQAACSHWRRFGLPGFAQFDNDTVFQGPHAHPNTVGRVTRLCLALGIAVVFAPPRETGFQAAIESFNGRWQAKVWNRFHFASRAALRSQSAKYVTACRRRSAARMDAAPQRLAFPEDFDPDLQDLSRGTIIYLRRTDEKGRASLLGRTFTVDRHWLHRLVRAEIDLHHRQIHFYALRRRDPTSQPLLRSLPHEIPQKPFKE